MSSFSNEQYGKPSFRPLEFMPRAQKNNRTENPQ